MKSFLNAFQLVVVILSLQIVGIANASSWSYSGNNGPSSWSTISSTCGGLNQSPINIDTMSTTKADHLGAFNFHNFTGAVSSALMINNGHTVKIDVGSSDFSITGGGLGQRYVLYNVHFHWGSQDSHGSEHTVDGRSHPMEVHFVTYASAYGDISTALGNNDGLAVLGFFFEIGGSTNAAWDTLFTLLNQVTYSSNNVSVPSNLELNTLLPGNLDTYYRYKGSLTTPDCDEVVTWTLFKETIKISAAQMAEFRMIYSNLDGAANVTLSGNYRPVQSLEQRTVYTSSAYALYTPTALMCGTTLLWTMILLIKL